MNLEHSIPVKLITTNTMAEKNTLVTKPELILGKQPREEFQGFEQEFADYKILSKLSSEDKAYQAALLRSCLGTQARQIYNGLKYEEGEDKENIDLIMKKMKAHIIGEINEIYERYQFNKRYQKENEPIDHYIIALKELIKSCNYSTLEDSLLRDRLVVGIRDNIVRRTLLQKRKLTLNDTIDICKAAEMSKEQMSNMGVNTKDLIETEETVHKVQYTRERPYKQEYKRGQNSTRGRNSSQILLECRFCGQKHRWSKDNCPAYGARCSKCNGKHHFAVKCTVRGNRSPKKIYAVESHTEDEDSEDEYESVMHVTEEDSGQGEDIMSVGETQARKSSMRAHMIIRSRGTTSDVNFQLDTGATVNIIPVNVLPQSVQLSTCERS